MKKQLIATVLSLTLVFTACGTPAASPQSDQKSSSPSQESETAKSSASDLASLDAFASIEVDEGLFNVELTIPADFIGDQTQEDLDKISEEQGYKSITLNEDGSATYVMTKKQHEVLLDAYRNQINDTIGEMVGSDTYPNITKIEANDNFTEFTITTKSTELDVAESFSVINFYMYGGMYSIFSGEEVDNIAVTFVNADTGEIISTANSNDAESGQ